MISEVVIVPNSRSARSPDKIVGLPPILARPTSIGRRASRTPNRRRGSGRASSEPLLAPSRYKVAWGGPNRSRSSATPSAAAPSEPIKKQTAKIFIRSSLSLDITS